MNYGKTMQDNLFSKLKKIEYKASTAVSLSANENVMSKTARRYLSSVAADRYYFETNNGEYSDFPEFVAAGSASLDSLVLDSKQILMRMFDAKYVNLAPLSGIHAMLIVLLTLSEAGDVIASLSPQNQGHFATARLVERIGRQSILLPDREGDIDIEAASSLIKELGVTMIYIDAMSYTTPFDIAALRNAVGKDVLIIYDASHTLGLIGGGVFQHPLTEGADVICGNTHKTFPGPHKGLILAKEEAVGKRIEATGGSLYSSVHYNSLLALLVTVHEMNAFGTEYATSVIANARKLQEKLVVNGLIRVAVPPTSNHQVHIQSAGRKEAVRLMDKLRLGGISSHVCFSDNEGFFVRLGVQEVTRRGMGVNEMEVLAELIRKADQGNSINRATSDLAHAYQAVHFSFDGILENS